MKRIIFYVLMIFCVCGCPANNGGTQSIQSELVKTADYSISDTSVGEISMATPISCIDTLLRDEYHLKKELSNPDGDDSSLFTSYAIYQGDNLIIRITPEEENIDRIYSIMIFDPRYEISTTGIHVGDDIQKMKSHYHIDDVYFNIADGLYLMSNSFNGAFLIDLEGKGDKYESLDNLDNGLKIKAIIVYK